MDDATEGRRARGLSFGAAAEAYDRYRPGYGPEVVAPQLAVADGPVRTVVEIGAGTGLATRALLAAGLAVTAVEPDPAMLAVLRRRCANASVSMVEATFEGLDGRDLGPFDALVSASAFHWTRPEGRWDRVAALVRTGGAVMILGGHVRPADQAVAELEDSTVERIAGPSEPPGPISIDGPPWPSDELLADDRFVAVSHRVVPRRYTVSRADWLGRLGTVSSHLMLTPEVRAAVEAALADRLPETIAVDADLTVHTARRR